VSGQYARALEEWDHLLKISPTDVVFASYNRARIYIYQRDYARAEAEIAKGLAFESHHPMLRAYGALIDYYKGEIEKATLILEDVLEKNPDLHSQKIFLAYCYLARGERERAMELIDEQVIATARADQDIAYRFATVYALDKQKDKAIEWLERSIAMGNENYPWMSMNPNWDALRDDARFIATMDSLKERWERLSEPARE
jgi:serine/threonine-protein kinase